MICHVCQKDKALTEFYKIPTVKLTGCCKECTLDKGSTKLYHIKKYGLTPDDYRAMLQQQDFKCAICKSSHKERPEKKFGRARLAVDHDHVTGKIRGLLCYSCNRLLGFAQDREDILHNAVDYLSPAA